MPEQIFAASQSFYDSPRTVSAYSFHFVLQPAELAILDALRPRLAAMDMLDLGVGAGRTVPHFAHLAKSYVGSDFSGAMITACRKIFPKIAFEVADASDLAVFAEASFDFVLFSFNGIDCMQAGGRAKALAELHRLVRPGGMLAFSSHNLQFLPHSRSWRQHLASLHPKYCLDSGAKLLKFLLRTRSAVIAADRKTGLVRERHLGFDVPIFFVEPAHQIAVLEAQGWRDVRAFASKSGREVARGADLAELTDPWVYYFCRKPDGPGPNTA